METEGACRDEAGKVKGVTLYKGRDCKERCNIDPKCTGYLLTLNESSYWNWCETYTSAGLKGNGVRGYTCNMKQGMF